MSLCVSQLVGRGRMSGFMVQVEDDLQIPRIQDTSTIVSLLRPVRCQKSHVYTRQDGARPDVLMPIVVEHPIDVSVAIGFC